MPKAAHARSTSTPAFTPAFTTAAPHGGLVAQICSHQRVDSLASLGERLAAVMLEENEDGLAAFAAALGDDSDNTVVNCLAAAEDSLGKRLQLVNAAITRLCLAVDPRAGNGTEH